MSAVINQTVRDVGLVTMELFDWRTQDVFIGGVNYKKTAKDRGLVLNTCPWCGNSLRWWGEA
jgi:hypothetical protein